MCLFSARYNYNMCSVVYLFYTNIKIIFEITIVRSKFLSKCL